MSPAAAAAFAELQEVALRPHPDPGARVAALDATCLALCERLGLDVAGPGYHAADVRRREELLAAATPPARRRWRKRS